MDSKSFYNETFDTLPERIICSNFINCVFNTPTTFERCNLDRCTFNSICMFERSNVNDEEDEIIEEEE